MLVNQSRQRSSQSPTSLSLRWAWHSSAPACSSSQWGSFQFIQHKVLAYLFWKVAPPSYWLLPGCKCILMYQGWLGTGREQLCSLRTGYTLSSPTHYSVSQVVKGKVVLQWGASTTLMLNPSFKASHPNSSFILLASSSPLECSTKRTVFW